MSKQEQPISVLYLSSWYPNKYRQMLGVFVKRHAQAAALLCDVSLIYVCAGDKDELEEFTEENVYHVISYFKRTERTTFIPKSISNAIRYIAAWKRAERTYLQKKKKPLIIQVNIFYPVAAIALWLRLKWSTPYLLLEHWTGYDPADGRFKGMPMKVLSKYSAKFAAGIVVVAHALEKRMLENGLRNKYYIVSNIVDTDLFCVKDNKKKLTGITHFFHLSSLDEAQKNIQGIIRVFKRLNEELPSTHLTIAGDGINRNELMAQCREYGMAERVNFPGVITGENLASAYQNASAFVLFSNYENLPCVILEALCCGIPVIATRTGDIPLYITACTGILVEPGDEEQLYAAMKSVAEGKKSFNPYEIRKTVADKVNSEVVARELTTIYKTILTHS